MKPIPIGNDLNVSWAINRMGEGVPLSAYKLDLYMECGYAKMPVTEYTVDGNTVKFPFWGKDQKKTGVYKLVAVGNGGEKGMFTATCCGAFQLSSGCEVSCQSDLQVPAEVSCQSDLQVPAEVSCQSDLQVPANGLSAYQVWLSNGHQGTEEDFLDWLQQPAQSAAEEAGKATEAANTAASKADTAATKATEAAETATQATEELKGAAGEATDAANEANTARDAANTAAEKAETAATEATEAAGKANEAAQGIDAKIATKQDTLESGVNIKTINGMTVLGAGNMVLMPCIQHYKWVSNAATTRKQVPAALRARDVKISYNDNSGVYHVEQYQSDDLSDEAWGYDANWKGCRTPMTPMFEAAGAVFNDETGYYEMNWLTDLTEGEILGIYAGTFGWKNVDFSRLWREGNSSVLRTNFPLQDAVNRSTFGVQPIAIHAYPNVETLCLKSMVGSDRIGYWEKALYLNNCTQVIGTIVMSSSSSGVIFTIVNASELVNMHAYVNRRGINQAINFSSAVKLSLDSFEFLVSNTGVSETHSLTITVHPDVYTKLTDPANAEWYAVNTAAQAKQIAFATTEAAQAMMLPSNALPEPQSLDGELLAPAGCYLTQAEETPIENRLFLTRKVILPGEDVSKWRVATTEEKREQDEYFEQQLPS